MRYFSRNWVGPFLDVSHRGIEFLGCSLCKSAAIERLSPLLRIQEVPCLNTDQGLTVLMFFVASWAFQGKFCLITLSMLRSLAFYFTYHRIIRRYVTFVVETKSLNEYINQPIFMFKLSIPLSLCVTCWDMSRHALKVKNREWFSIFITWFVTGISGVLLWTR